MRRVARHDKIQDNSTIINTRRLGQLGAEMTDGRLAYAKALALVFRQLAGAMLVSWQRILRVGLLTAAISVLVTEVVACLVTAQFPPAPLTHLVAVAFASALGYGAAVTMLFVMLLKGGIRFIRYLEGDVEAGAQVASIFARREASDLGADILRMIGSVANRARASVENYATAKSRLVTPRHALASSVVAAVGLDVARAARTVAPRANGAAFHPAGRLDTRRDPDDAIIRAPAQAMQSVPVLASRLPRIAWTYDDQVSWPSPQPVSRASSPLPSTSDAIPTTPVKADVEADATHREVSEPPPEAANVPVLTGPPADRVSVVDEPRGTIDVPGLIPRGWRHSSRATRPLSVVTRPLPETRAGGLWERVSQALVGQTVDVDMASESDISQPLPDGGMAESGLGEVFGEDAWLNG